MLSVIITTTYHIMSPLKDKYLRTFLYLYHHYTYIMHPLAAFDTFPYIQYDSHVVDFYS